jgi:hypothetical protein
MGFKDIAIGSIMTLVFAMAILTFGTKLAVDNNSNINILDDPSLRALNNSAFGSLSEVQGTIQTQRENFETEKAQKDSQSDNFGLTAIIGNLKTFFSIGISGFNAIFIAISVLLGIPPIILNILSGVIILILILLSWRVIKVGGI